MVRLMAKDQETGFPCVIQRHIKFSQALMQQILVYYSQKRSMEFYRFLLLGKMTSHNSINKIPG